MRVPVAVTLTRGLVAAMFVVLTAVHPSEAATWTKVETPHFLFIGEVSEGELRRIARTLEQFREVMTTLMPSTAVAQVTRVVVFANDRSLTPFKIRFKGQPVDLAGYFSGGTDVDYIVMNGEIRDLALRTVLHEYAHSMVQASVGRIPIWANEGLAEFYETYEEREGGKVALIGAPSPEHLQLIQQMTFMPLPELMAVTDASPIYNEGNRRSLLYAESWAVVHYLALGSPQRKGQFQTYLQQVKTGAVPAEAFRSAFATDPAGLENEVRQYVRRLLFLQMKITFEEKLGAGAIRRGTVLPDTEAQGYLGELLVRVNPEGARSFLGRAGAGQPSAGVLHAQALLELQQDHQPEAVRLLEQAAALDPLDARIHLRLGRLLLARREAEHDDAARATMASAARAALARADELQPGRPDTLAMLAYAEWSDSNDVARVIPLLERAIRLAPTRDDYRLTLAEAFASKGDYEGASTHLGLLMARSSDEAVRARAREVLTRVATERNRMMSRANAGSAVSPAPNAVAAPAARLAESGATPRPIGTPSKNGRLILELRPVQAGEQRVLATLRGVDCRGGVTLDVGGSDGPLQLTAAALTAVEFVSYRSDTPPNVACGALARPMRTLVTYRPDATGATTKGVAVAVELIPDDYEPR